MPLACGLFFYDKDYTWNFESEPEPFADDRRLAAVASKVLGGGSTINGMIYSRGDPRDYDQWTQAGARDGRSTMCSPHMMSLRSTGHCLFILHPSLSSMGSS
jgi:choline dehydrogenase